MSAPHSRRRQRCDAAATVCVVGSIMNAQQQLEGKVRQRVSELTEFLRERQIPRITATKVRRHMEHLYKRQTGCDARCSDCTVLSCCFTRSVTHARARSPVTLFMRAHRRSQRQLCPRTVQLQVRRV